jgi:hypothetical protein
MVSHTQHTAFEIRHMAYSAYNTRQIAYSFAYGIQHTAYVRQIAYGVRHMASHMRHMAYRGIRHTAHRLLHKYTEERTCIEVRSYGHERMCGHRLYRIVGSGIEFVYGN